MVTLSHLNESLAFYLANILSTDEPLNNANSNSSISTIKNISGRDFLNKTNNWAIDNNALSFAIVLKEKAIGLISLSHINKNKAQIGSWLSSNFWNKGYTSTAFSLIIDIAKSHNIHHLSSSIDRNNLAAQKIWINRGAIITKAGEVLTATLII